MGKKTQVKAISLPETTWDQIDTLARHARETDQVPRLRGWRSYIMQRIIHYGLPAVADDLWRGRSGT